MTTDQRPAVWTGHLVISGKDPAASAGFYKEIGMREVAILDEVAIFELRGGTHLVVRKDLDAAGNAAEWDLMVDDIAATHADWKRKGLDVTDIEQGPIHEAFTVTDPDGNTIQVNSSHVVGPV
ncbi:MAG TPA: VOC family protein [Acidimicrobiia bacterium]|nr:VOC family protein [Acidimicrobiia bacterium]